MLIDEDMSASDIHLVQDLLPEYYNGYTLGPMLEEIPFDEELFLSELNKRRATTVKKEDAGIVFDTTGTY